VFSRSDIERMRAFVAAVIRGEAAAPVPPAELVRLNHLGPIAYRRGLGEHRAEYAASTIMAARRTALLAEIAGELGRRGIRLAPIKGMAYVGIIYADPAERPMQDIDLLVPRPQLPAAKACMMEIGFARFGAPRELSGYYHAVGFRRGDIIVELHRGIVQHQRTGVRMGDVWRRAKADPAGFERLDPVDELIFCALNIARTELAVPALSYLDVSRLWQRLDGAARASLERRAVEYRIERSLCAVLAMTELLRAGARGPLPVRGARLLPGTDDILLGRRPGRLRQIGQKLVLTEGVRELVGLGVTYSAVLVDGLRNRR
jgi:hypothetical protein